MATTMIERIQAMQQFQQKATALIESNHGIRRELKSTDVWEKVAEMDRNVHDNLGLTSAMLSVSKRFLDRKMELSEVQAIADDFIAKLG